MPDYFDADLKHLRNLVSESNPLHTTDDTPEGFFSEPFMLHNMEQMKKRLCSHSTKSTHGIDHVSYKKISSILDEVLLKLFNYCSLKTTAPHNWFITTVLFHSN
jgi:hypothetical protein